MKFIVQWTHTEFWYGNIEFPSKARAVKEMERLAEMSPDYDHRVIEMRVVAQKKKGKRK